MFIQKFHPVWLDLLFCSSLGFSLTFRVTFMDSTFKAEGIWEENRLKATLTVSFSFSEGNKSISELTSVPTRLLLRSYSHIKSNIYS